MEFDVWGLYVKSKLDSDVCISTFTKKEEALAAIPKGFEDSYYLQDLGPFKLKKGAPNLFKNIKPKSKPILSAGYFRQKNHGGAPTKIFFYDNLNRFAKRFGTFQKPEGFPPFIKPSFEDAETKKPSASKSKYVPPRSNSLLGIEEDGVTLYRFSYKFLYKTSKPFIKVTKVNYAQEPSTEAKIFLGDLKPYCDFTIYVYAYHKKTADQLVSEKLKEIPER